MSLATAIFLSSLVLGFVALFVATKDSWKWKKIILWPIATLSLIAAGLWIYNTIEERPKVQTTFWDIPLGATQADVKFLKGAPNVVPKEVDRDKWEYLWPASSNSDWDYLYRVAFKNGKVWLIEYFASPSRTYGPGIQTIDEGDSLETIIQKFGEPARVSTSVDQLSRIYSFTKYQVAFELKQNRVTGYGIFDASVAPKGVEYVEK